VSQPPKDRTESYLFRPITLADRAAVDYVCAYSFEDGDYIPAVFDAWVADRQAQFYGAFDLRGKLAGIGRVRLIDGGATIWCEGDRVALEYRRRGVGKALLGHAVEWARSRGALRLRAAVASGNEASKALFAACGFRSSTRFDTWVAEPGPGGRLPRPLPLDELEHGFAFVQLSVPYQLTGSVYACGWTIHDLDMDRLALHMERQEVLLAGDSIGALAIVINFTAGAVGRPTVAFLAGAPVAVTRLLRGVCTLAHLRGLREVRALIPAGADLDGMLLHTGFTRATGNQLLLQQLDLAAHIAE
jgi:GNAT superfamily N-acetyltransferase